MDGSAQADQPRRCVVVIDSDESALERTRVLLEREDRAIVTARSADEVRRALTGVRPFAVVIEPVLADCDGFSLCRSILDGYEYDPPVVLLASSRLSGKAAFLRAREVGAFLFVERPAQDRTLVDTIAHIEARGGLGGESESEGTRPPMPDEQAPAVGGVRVGNTEIASRPIDLSRASSGEFEHWIDDAFATFTDDAPSATEGPAPAADVGAAPGEREEEPELAALDDGPTESIADDSANAATMDDVTDTFDVEEVLETSVDPADADEPVPAPEPNPVAARFAGAGIEDDPIGSALEDAFSGLGGDAADERARRATAPPIAATATAVLEPSDEPRDGIAVIDVGTATLVPAEESKALVAAPSQTLPAPPAAPPPPLSARPGGSPVGRPVKFLLGGLAAAALVAAGLLLAELLPWNRAPETRPARTRHVPVVADPAPLPREGTVLGAGLTNVTPSGERVDDADAASTPVSTDQIPPPVRLDGASRSAAAATPSRPTAPPTAGTDSAGATPAEPRGDEPSAPPSEPPSRSASTSGGVAESSGVAAEGLSTERDAGMPRADETPGAAAVMAGVVPLAEAADLAAAEASAASTAPEAVAPPRAAADAPVVMPMPAVTVEPRLIRSSRIEPRYPIAARRVRASGAVLLKLTVSESGDVSEVEVLDEPPGALGFGAAAADAVTRWRYEPATRDGEPIESETTVRIVFSP